VRGKHLCTIAMVKRTGTNAAGNDLLKEGGRYRYRDHERMYADETRAATQLNHSFTWLHELQSQRRVARRSTPAHSCAVSH
jgi:hypothetical protein